MNKFDYTESENELNAVLAHQDDQISALDFPAARDIESSISDSASLLKSLGYKLPTRGEARALSSEERPPVVMPSWDQMLDEALLAGKEDARLEELFTQDELVTNHYAVKALNEQYDQVHRLDSIDITIAANASLLAATVDTLLVGIPTKTPDGLKAGPLSNYIREYFDKRYPPSEMEKLANSEMSKVPYDAQDNRNTRIHVEGLSAYYHRLLSLGHDPLLGLVFGVSDILSGKMTTIDKAGNIVSQVMDCYSDRREMDIFLALAKQIEHFRSDVTTSMGLPVPMMALCSLMQFGSIGEYEQTVAEIVQGMYYEGYDFIHFCSMSIPVATVEVIVRLCYAVKRIKEGVAVKDAIPLSTSRERNPKLATMLFTAHSGATAINAGKVAFTKNPLAINYPQWIAFSKYAYQQLKWIMFEKPEKRDKYVRAAINDDMSKTFEDIDLLFLELCPKSIVLG